jgi:hypothetical protein
MVGAIDVGCSQRDGRDPAWQGLASYRCNNGSMPLSIAQ